MQRNALKNIGQVIAASAEEKTIEQLSAQGKRKFRVVNGKKVVQLIEAIVDDLIAREAGDMAKRDRDSIVKQTQRKFDRVMKLQAEQDARLAQLREELRVTDEERARLSSDKTFLEEQLHAARKSAPEGEAVRLLTRELGRVKASLEAIERKTNSLDGSSIERIVQRLGDREAQLTERFHDDLDEMRGQLDKISADSERLRDAAVEAVFERLAEKRAVADDGLVERIESRIGDLGTRLEELAEQTSRREGRDSDELAAQMREIDERIAAVEAASSNLKEEAISALLDRLSNHEADLEKGLVARVVIQLEALASQVQTLEMEIVAGRDGAAGVMSDRIGERIDAIESTLHDETRGLREAVEEMRLAQEERENATHELVSGQLEATRSLLLDELTERFIERDAAATTSFHDALTDVRASVTEQAGRTSAEVAALRATLIASVDGLRVSGDAGIDLNLIDHLEERIFTPLQQELSVLRDDVGTRHVEALAAVAAADERGNALAARLEQLSESVASLAHRVDENAEAQTRAVVALGDQLAANAAASASGFDAALETALDKITRTMESATAKPIEISAEATDVLLSKIFDAGDHEMSSNLDDLDVEESNSGVRISRNLGRLRALRGASTRKNGSK